MLAVTRSTTPVRMMAAAPAVRWVRASPATSQPSTTATAGFTKA